MQDTRVQITDDFVDKAVHPKAGQTIYRDSRLIGFGLRITSGKKSFIAEARVNEKNRRVTIGRADFLSVDEARKEARQLLRLMASGIHPLTIKERRK